MLVSGKVLTDFQQSGVVLKGGKNPTWTDSDSPVLRFVDGSGGGSAIRLRRDEAEQLVLYVEAWDKDTLRDDLIGIGRSGLGWVTRCEGGEEVRECSVGLVEKAGSSKGCGEIQVSVAVSSNGMRQVGID